MKSSVVGGVILALVFTMLVPLELAAQRRRVVVRHRPGRTTLVVRAGHPLRRRLPGTVIVHPARRAVIIGAPLVFLPALAWTAAVIALPARERLIWQDSETIESDEGWVDSNFGIDGTGSALYLEINGSAELNFAEVTFANGNVQVVDFNEKAHGSGIYKLLDFANDRHVMTTRILAQSKSKETKLTVFLGA